MRNNLTVLFLLLAAICFPQEGISESGEVKINEFIQGSLMIPAPEEKIPLVILIQGSGATDRNGNRSFGKNDSFKKLAQELHKEGIASFRYDKRLFQAQRMGIKETEMRFEDFISDAISVLDHFNGLNNFGKTVVIGHDQGSLVGMIAAQTRADGFVSIAGSGQPIDSVIISQVAQQFPELEENTRQSFMELREKGSSRNFNPVLRHIFEPNVQPFMLSYMRYNPAVEIAELEIPVLIISGTTDIQVPETEAQLLKDAKPDAELLLLKDMNHVLREIKGRDNLEHSKSYNEPGRPLHPELVPAIVRFMKGLE